MALPQPDRISGVAPAHVRHKPEQTLLYQLVEQYWPEFQTQLSETGRSRYRERVMLAGVRKFKNPADDVEADGLGESGSDSWQA
ncbi:MAG: hypothetical protein ACI9XK_003408 [Granulosicoccus sp.]|jgi:hypothetical protein